MKLFNKVLLISFLILVKMEIVIGTCYDEVSKNSNKNLKDNINNWQNKFLSSSDQNGITGNENPDIPSHYLANQTDHQLSNENSQNQGSGGICRAINSFLDNPEVGSAAAALALAGASAAAVFAYSTAPIWGPAIVIKQAGKAAKRFFQKHRNTDIRNLLKTLIELPLINSVEIQKLISSIKENLGGNSFEDLQRALLLANNFNMLCGSTENNFGISYRKYLNVDELISMLSEPDRCKNFIDEVNSVERKLLKELKNNHHYPENSISYKLKIDANKVYNRYLYSGQKFSWGKTFKNTILKEDKESYKIITGEVLELNK